MTPKIIGYGICGPGEAGRYMRETLDEFERLCDEVIICLNGTDADSLKEEIELLADYGYRFWLPGAHAVKRHYTVDFREWGKEQWRIKENFLDRKVRTLAKDGDVMIALDMDERFDRHLTREWLQQMPFDAYHTFVVDLWNDEDHYKPESCFWKVQIFRWNGDVAWTAKPLHCGLVPRWAASYNKYAPFLQIHKGLMTKESRQRKIARYEKYDPHQQYLGRQYYWMITTDTAEPFDEDALHATIASEVATYKQTKPRQSTSMPKRGRFAYVENPGGIVVDIPESQLHETLKRPGFTLVGWADEAEKEMDEMFAEDEEEEESVDPVANQGSYQRGTGDEKAEVDALNERDDVALLPGGSTVITKPTGSVSVRNRVGMKEAEKVRQIERAKVDKNKPVHNAPAKKKAPAKKSAKKRK